MYSSINTVFKKSSNLHPRMPILVRDIVDVIRQVVKDNIYKQLRAG